MSPRLTSTLGSAFAALVLLSVLEAFAADPLQPVASDELSKARTRAREVLRAHCAECHLGTLPTAVPKALAIFNLVDEDWAVHMSDQQLHKAVKRLPSQERFVFQSYVDLELERRHPKQPQPEK